MFNNSFTFSVLSYEFTLIDEFVLRQLLNRYELNKLSQLSISVSLSFG
jgi:hypothetical protein